MNPDTLPTSASVEAAYSAARRGDWAELLHIWVTAPHMAQVCSRYRRPGSGWGFLNPAAYFGDEAASRVLIRAGACVDAAAQDGLTPAAVADQRGHSALAAVLRDAAIGESNLWAAPTDPDLLPSSNQWQHATQAQAPRDMVVAYGGGQVRIAQGAQYWVDGFGRALVGWHGTYNPPCGMDGEPLCGPEPPSQR